jgi:hypothetical protein
MRLRKFEAFENLRFSMFAKQSFATAKFREFCMLQKPVVFERIFEGFFEPQKDS